MKSADNKIISLKPLTDGMYAKNESGGISHYEGEDVSLSYSKEHGFYLHVYDSEDAYLLEDCGKTWALTKEELNNEKETPRLHLW